MGWFTTTYNKGEDKDNMGYGDINNDYKDELNINISQKNLEILSDKEVQLQKIKGYWYGKEYKWETQIMENDDDNNEPLHSLDKIDQLDY